MNKEIYIELKELNSSLGENDDRFIYKEPDGYFEEMQNEVLRKLNKKNKGVVLLSKYKWMISSAAILVIVFGTFLIMNNSLLRSNEITSEDAFNYLMENIEDLDNKSLAYAIMGSDIEIEDVILSTDDEIDDYIDDNIDEITEEDIELLF